MSTRADALIIEEMRKERDDLRDAFQEYGTHARYCITRHVGRWREECDCGFRETWDKLMKAKR